ncbi:protein DETOXIFICATION 48-like [Ananas comosus]|uniref:Protein DETOXIFICATION n=1 Tax=Ananas comosus TaxID=4615 RepID=A0A6P5G4X7_ANACO|nr:protein DETOXIFICATION 48-like [Ananas comosus]
MCNTASSPLSTSHHLLNPIKPMDDEDEDDEDKTSHQHLHRLPTLSEGNISEARIDETQQAKRVHLCAQFEYSAYCSSSSCCCCVVSMVFLGTLGELPLAAGSLAIGFANITGYSVLSGLAMGMEPICGQAFGAGRPDLLALTLHRAVLLLLLASLPIALLWLFLMHRILLLSGQDPAIAGAARAFIACSVPDLVLLSFLHPLRIYLRAQSVTAPVAACSAASVLLHGPLNYLLVHRLRMGIAGVALASVLTNLNLFLSLLAFLLLLPNPNRRSCWLLPGPDCLRGWSNLLRLAVPTCVSVCLEWWWYELMIVLCGLLANPTATVASMGILIQTTSLVYVFPSSLGLGASTRVGNELGAGRPARARRAALVALALAGATGLAAMAFAASVRHAWGRMFTSDADILRLTATALPIAGLCELGNCPQTAGCGVLRGSARPSAGAHINLGSFYLVGMPVAVGLAFVARMGFTGLWLGLLAAQASCAALMFYAVASTDWLLEVQKAKQLTQPPPPPPAAAYSSSSSSSSSSSPSPSPSPSPSNGSSNNNNSNDTYNDAINGHTNESSSTIKIKNGTSDEDEGDYKLAKLDEVVVCIHNGCHEEEDEKRAPFENDHPLIYL